jgi:hypothetical protein
MGRKTKKDYMWDGAFAELMEAAEQALAYERGARDGYRVVQVESTTSLRKFPSSKVVPKSSPSSRQKHKNADDK